MGILKRFKNVKSKKIGWLEFEGTLIAVKTQIEDLIETYGEKAFLEVDDDDFYSLFVFEPESEKAFQKRQKEHDRRLAKKQKKKEKKEENERKLYEKLKKKFEK